MNYGELKSFFLELINRSDITDNQTDLFLSMGMRRTERTLRTTMQKTYQSTTVTEPWAGFIPVPNDYLGLHYMKVNGVTINRIIDTQSKPDVAGSTLEYYIYGGRFFFRSDVNLDDVIELSYYKEFTESTLNSDITTYSEIIPDVIVYCALVYACDTFSDVRKANFEETFQALKTEVQDLSDRDDMTGGMVVSNPYAGYI
jgi:hypothetical protein